MAYHFLVLKALWTMACVLTVSGACPKIISRSEWGARPSRSVEYLSNQPVKYAFIHHSEGPECFTEASCIAAVKGYQNYHMDSNGWADIGYSFVIGGDGNVYEGRGWDRVGAHTLGYNSVGLESQSTSKPDIHVILIVVVIFLIILLVLAAILLFKCVVRLANKWREKQAEKALTRAISIYNSQEPLDDSDYVQIRPGDRNCHMNIGAHRSQTEIAFVHSNGRIERFRLLVSSNSRSEESLCTRRQDCSTTRALLHFPAPRNDHFAGNEETYTNFQPALIKLETVSAQCLEADRRESVSLRCCDIPPSYEEALEMPVVVSTNNMLPCNSRNLEVRDKLEPGYCNVEISEKKSMQIENRDCDRKQESIT